MAMRKKRITEEANAIQKALKKTPKSRRHIENGKEDWITK